MAPAFTLKVKGSKPFSPLQSFTDEDSVRETWRLCSKTAAHLEYGARLENLTWRLWHLRSVAVEDDDEASSSSFNRMSHGVAQKLDSDRRVQLRDLEVPEFKWTDGRDALRYKALLHSKRREERSAPVKQQQQQQRQNIGRSSSGAGIDTNLNAASSSSSSSSPSSSSSSQRAPQASSAMEVEASSSKSLTPPICRKLADKKMEEMRAASKERQLDVDRGEGPSRKIEEDTDLDRSELENDKVGVRGGGKKKVEDGDEEDEGDKTQVSSTWTIDDIQAAEKELREQGVELSGPLQAMLADLKRGDLTRVDQDTGEAKGTIRRRSSNVSSAAGKVTQEHAPSMSMDWSAPSRHQPWAQQGYDGQSLNANLGAYVGIPHPMQMPTSHPIAPHVMSGQGPSPNALALARNRDPAALETFALAMTHQQRPHTAGSGPASPSTPMSFTHQSSPLSHGNMAMPPTHHALNQALSMPSSPAGAGMSWNAHLGNSFALPKSTSMAEIHPSASMKEEEETKINATPGGEEDSGDDEDEDEKDRDTLDARQSDMPKTSKPQCANCGATSTPLWRRDANFALQCNACGLYLKLHKVPRPRSLKQRRADKGKTNGPSSAAKHPARKNSQSGRLGRAKEEVGDEEDNSGDSEGAKSDEWVGIHAGSTCANCGTSTTPLWRKDAEGRIICNACGLYYKLHNSHRPVTMRMDAIKRRARYDERRMAASSSSSSSSAKNNVAGTTTPREGSVPAQQQQQQHTHSNSGDMTNNAVIFGSGAPTPTQPFFDGGSSNNSGAAGSNEASILASMQIPMDMWENQLCPMGAWGEECCQNFPQPGHVHGPASMGHGGTMPGQATGGSNSDVLAAAVAAATAGVGAGGAATSSPSGGPSMVQRMEGGAPRGAEMGIIGAFGHNSDWFLNLAQQQQQQHQQPQHQQPQHQQDHHLHHQPPLADAAAAAVAQAQAHAQAVTFQTAQQFVASLVGTPEEATGPSYPLKRRRVTSTSPSQPPQPPPPPPQQQLQQQQQQGSGAGVSTPHHHFQQQPHHTLSPQQVQHHSPHARPLHHHHQPHHSHTPAHASSLVASPATSTHVQSPSVGSSEWWQELHNEAIASSTSSAANLG